MSILLESREDGAIGVELLVGITDSFTLINHCALAHAAESLSSKSPLSAYSLSRFSSHTKASI